jgi:hypothetical protein
MKKYFKYFFLQRLQKYLGVIRIRIWIRYTDLRVRIRKKIFPDPEHWFFVLDICFFFTSSFQCKSQTFRKSLMGFRCNFSTSLYYLESECTGLLGSELNNFN